METTTSTTTRSEPAPPESLFGQIVWKRVHEAEKNVVVIVTGPSGSGKSNASIALAHEVDPEFNLGQVFFDVQALVEYVASAPKRRGRVLILEEAGVAAHNRGWQEETNRALIHLMQTWRVDGQVLILNLPYLSFVDGQVRKQCHYWVEMSDQVRGAAKLKRLLPKEDIRGSPTFFPFVKVTTESGRSVKITAVRFRKAPKALWGEYERLSRAYKHSLQVELGASLGETKRKQAEKREEKVDLSALSERIMDEMRKDATAWRKSLKKGGWRLNRDLLKEKNGLSHAQARSLAALINEQFPDL